MSHDREDSWLWRGPAIAGVLGLGVVATLLAGWRWTPEVVAGSIFLLSWALAGLALLGALFGSGRGREAWIGAASLGLGYLVMTFSLLGSSQWPTNHLIDALVRTDDPRTADEEMGEVLTNDEASRKARQALERPVSIPYREGTTLRVFLDRIGESGREMMGEPLRIQATSELFSFRPADLDALRVFIEGEHMPARDALRIGLAPLGLTYRVQSGTIRIYPDASQPPPYAEDPIMIAGHSLIALLAMAFGGVVAPVVAGLLKRPGE